MLEVFELVALVGPLLFCPLLPYPEVRSLTPRSGLTASNRWVSCSFLRQADEAGRGSVVQLT